MEKEFNITGICIPNRHYMVDISNKLDNTIKLINKEKYFIINRPRQYGKTTTLYMVERYLNTLSEYLVISISFEGIGDLIFQEEKLFSKEFLQIMADSLSLNHEELSDFLEKQKGDVESFSGLSRQITKFIKECNKKVILMIDEVDKSSNNQLFLSFLGMLRNKYLLRNAGKDYTFHSVILAGVHDVKSLKLKIRSDEEHKYNSPWNIASDFDVDMSFSIEEISTMLEDYIQNKDVNIDKAYFSERLYFYTSGYPFLVSKLCKIIDEKLMNANELKWEKEYIDIAVKVLLKESNTNFDSVIKNIENNNDLFQIVKSILILGNKIDYNIHNPNINLGIMYGIFKNYNGKLKMNNRVYEQLIYDYIASKIQTTVDFKSSNEYSNFVNEDSNLNVEKILLKFQEFMHIKKSTKCNQELNKCTNNNFYEADGRLLFLAFVSPIINGIGFAFKEVQGGEEKRFDIVITYNKKMYILELKRWNGEEYHKKGLLQLAGYLEQYGLDEGYVLIFDFRKLKGDAGKVEKSTVNLSGKEKNITQVYC